MLLPIAAFAVERYRSNTRHRLQALAQEWNAHFAADDRFKLAPRIASQAPCPGAADVKVSNIIYGKSQDRYHFIFTLHWTHGVLRWKKHATRVGAVMDDQPCGCTDREPRLRLADESLGYIQQYEQLRQTCCDKRD